jgi:xanthine/uracil permease
MMFATDPVLVLMAAVAHVAIGFIWYGPMFGRVWAKFADYSIESTTRWQQAKKNIGGTYVKIAFAAAVLAYSLAYLLALFSAKGYLGASGVVVGLWIGYLVVTAYADFRTRKKPMALWAIDSFYPLVSMMIMSWILVGSR